MTGQNRFLRLGLAAALATGAVFLIANPLTHAIPTNQPVACIGIILISLGMIKGSRKTT